ncbi:MAG: sigma 54-interacting transcriptional regulator, partial [Myxococcota bacterium]|nr:sigma 54-interacting transcriptional regulator [Myxococcota bacterium]
MTDTTNTLTTGATRQLRLRQAALCCTSGPEAGQQWRLEHDVIRIGSARSADVGLSDNTVSRHHAEIVRTPEGMLLRDLGSTNGTFVGPIKVREVFLGPDTRFRVGRTELRYRALDEVVDVVPVATHQFEGMVGASVSLREVFGVLQKVAPTSLTVLITGETGTGKELASRAVHVRSRCAEGPFVVFDCGAAPENLIESALFGHARGAFTGAVESRQGVFEAAHGGTIFLDEIGELPLELQPKLLRVLEQREVCRIGEHAPRAIDVRVVAATNRDLQAEVRAGRFREDLYYRLAVVEVCLPPLRERLADVPMLVDHLLARSSHNRGVSGLTPEVRSVFEAYRWPGNVRELQNVIERALPFCEREQVTLDALPAALRAAAASRDTRVPGAAAATHVPEVRGL